MLLDTQMVNIFCLNSLSLLHPLSLLSFLFLSFSLPSHFIAIKLILLTSAYGVICTLIQVGVSLNNRIITVMNEFLVLLCLHVQFLLYLLNSLYRSPQGFFSFSFLILPPFQQGEADLCGCIFRWL